MWRISVDDKSGITDWDLVYPSDHCALNYKQSVKENNIQMLKETFLSLGCPESVNIDPI